MTRLPELTPAQLADELRRHLDPRLVPEFDESIESMSLEPSEPAPPGRPWDHPFSSCAVLISLSWIVNDLLRAGALPETDPLFDAVEGLLVRFPRRESRAHDDPSMWAAVETCFLENVLPVEDPALHARVMDRLGPMSRGIAVEHGWDVWHPPPPVSPEPPPRDPEVEAIEIARLRAALDRYTRRGRADG